MTFVFFVGRGKAVALRYEPDGERDTIMGGYLI